jgi:hypothetical protein
MGDGAELFEKAMEENDDAIAPSMLYAYAAIMEGVAYSGIAANFWDMVRRVGIYLTDSYIDAGQAVWSLRADFVFVVGGVTRTLVMPSNVPVGDLNVSPGGNKTPIKFMHTGPTDPYWT